MKAMAVFKNSREIGIIEHPEPKITTPTEVKVQILEVGACGTDREICTFEYGTPPGSDDYLIIGHESLGKVVEIGSAVSDVKIGDLVVIMVRRPCHHAGCQPCRAGRQDFCTTGDFIERGIKQAHGFLTEYVVDDQKYMIVVPPELKNIGVLTEPLTIAEKALGQVKIIQSRLPWNLHHSAVVLGAGPVGLLGAMALTSRKFKTFVYSSELPSDQKAQLVEKMGATYISAKTHSIEALAKVVGNIDLVYEATGSPSLSFDIIKVLGINGIFIFTGIPGHKDPIASDLALIMRNMVLKNQDIFGSVNASHENYQDAVRDLVFFQKHWPSVIEQLITNRLSIESDSIKEVLCGRMGGIKNVIQWLA